MSRQKFFRGASQHWEARQAMFFRAVKLVSSSMDGCRIDIDMMLFGLSIAVTWTPTQGHRSFGALGMHEGDNKRDKYQDKRWSCPFQNWPGEMHCRLKALVRQVRQSFPEIQGEGSAIDTKLKHHQLHSSNDQNPPSKCKGGWRPGPCGVYEDNITTFP